MVPFKKLQNLADKVRDQMKSSICITVEYWSWERGDNNPIRYSLWNDKFKTHKYFNTVAELIIELKNLLSSRADESIELNSKK